MVRGVLINSPKKLLMGCHIRRDPRRGAEILSVPDRRSSISFTSRGNFKIGTRIGNRTLIPSAYPVPHQGRRGPMIRLLGACGAAIFLLGMLAGYMVSAFVPATAQTQMQLVAPQAT